MNTLLSSFFGTAQDNALVSSPVVDSPNIPPKHYVIESPKAVAQGERQVKHTSDTCRRTDSRTSLGSDVSWDDMHFTEIKRNVSGASILADTVTDTTVTLGGVRVDLLDQLDVYWKEEENDDDFVNENIPAIKLYFYNPETEEGEDGGTVADYLELDEDSPKRNKRKEVLKYLQEGRFLLRRHMNPSTEKEENVLLLGTCLDSVFDKHILLIDEEEGKDVRVSESQLFEKLENPNGEEDLGVGFEELMKPVERTVLYRNELINPYELIKSYWENPETILPKYFEKARVYGYSIEDHQTRTLGTVEFLGSLFRQVAKTDEEKALLMNTLRELNCGNYVFMSALQACEPYEGDDEFMPMAATMFLGSTDMEESCKRFPVLGGRF